MKRTFLRVITGLIIFGILLFYVPTISVEACSEIGHLQRVNLDCGSLFHCPFILSIGFLMNVHLPLKGNVILISHLPNTELIAQTIFHPPEYPFRGCSGKMGSENFIEN